MRKFVLLVLRAKAQFINVVDYFAQVVAALNFVFDLPENLPYFVFDGVWPGRLLREAMQVWKELLVDEISQVVAGHRGVVVELAVLALGRGPCFPAVGFVEDVGVFFPVESGLIGLVLFQSVEIFQEQQPRGLLCVIQFGCASRLFPENVVDIFECLFKHAHLFL
jgi:hypothetical protein